LTPAARSASRKETAAANIKINTRIAKNPKMIPEARAAMLGNRMA